MTIKFPIRLFNTLWFPAALGLYSLAFFFPLPSQLNYKGIQIVDEAIILISCAFIFLAFNKNSWGWKTLALFFALLIFTLPLLRLWKSAESNYNLVLGLLPWSDAGGYYADAINLLQGGLFGEFSGRRPFFASFLAILLKVSGENIQGSVIVLTIITALAVFLFALEVRENFGSLAGAGVVLLLQFYYRQFAGVLLTEQLGLPLGLIALASLFYAIRHKNKWCFGSGLLFLTLALFTRAGAFFALPAILFTGSLLFKENNRIVAKNVIIFSCAIMVAWGLNLALGWIVVTPGNESMGNFSYTLYGQAVGGKGWTQVSRDHPEINLLRGPEQYRVVYLLAFDEIRRNPSGLATGFLKAWKDFFIPSRFAGFSFIQPGDKYSSPIIQFILTILMFIGLFQSWQRRKDGAYLFLLNISFGIFISIPFIPPSEASYMRVYAVTIVIPILLAGIGLRDIIQKWIPSRSPISPWLTRMELILSGIGASLVLVILLGALIIRIMAHPTTVIPMNCPVGSIPLQFELTTGSFLSVVTNESGQSVYLPTISARTFRKSLRAFPGVYSDFSIPLIETVTPPILFTYTRNQLTGDFIWLIAPPELAANTRKTILACGKTISPESSVIEIQFSKVIP